MYLDIFSQLIFFVS